MKLHYWKGQNGIENFGDQLNTIIWEHFLSDVLNDDDDHLFFAIGTLLNQKMPQAEKITILGSGVGYGNPPLNCSNWEILCVRGPLSAKALKIKNSYAITDPAVLIRRIGFKKQNAKFIYSFIPHWQNDCILLRRICEELSINYISPIQNPIHVINEISKSRYVMAEAMHGAIVADALRVPWMCIQDTNNPDYLPFKWEDWLMSMRLNYEPAIIPSTNLDQSILFNKIARYRQHQATRRFFQKIMLENKVTLSKDDVINLKCAELESTISLFRNQTLKIR